MASFSLGPWGTMELLNLVFMYQKGCLSTGTCWTYEIKIQRVFKEIEAFDNVGVVDKAEQHDFSGQSTDDIVLHPGMLRYFVLDDELDSDFMPFDTMTGRHDKAVSA